MYDEWHEHVMCGKLPAVKISFDRVAMIFPDERR
jgi:hypothetical protein